MLRSSGIQSCRSRYRNRFGFSQPPSRQYNVTATKVAPLQPLGSTESENPESVLVMRPSEVIGALSEDPDGHPCEGSPCG